MILIRAEMSCLGYPDGRVPHGYVDVKVQGDDQNYAEEILLGQLDCCCLLSGNLSNIDFSLLDQKENDFDQGDMCAVVIEGKGDALISNPVGKILLAY